MKIKLDENSALLKNLGHEVDTAHEEQLVGHTDAEIWQAVQKESRFLITQDLDFSDRRQFAPGSHHGILLLRLHSPSRANLINRITELFHKETVEEWRGCFVVSTERKIRVVRSNRKPKK